MKSEFKLEVFVCKLLLSVLLFFLRSYLVLIVWNWRLVEYLPELKLPVINFGEACSLNISIVFIVVGLLNLQPIDNKDKGEYYGYYYGLFTTILLIGVTYIISLF